MPKVGPKATPIKRVLHEAQYWRLRASIGDVERAQAKVQAAGQELGAAMQERNRLLKEAAGADVDLNFVSNIDWDDVKFSIELHPMVPDKSRLEK